MPRTIALVFAFLLPAAPALAAPVPGWTPGAWAAEDTVELTTDRPDEGAHSFPVWIVVLDDQAYVRLGGRAADRVQKSKSAPYVGVKIAGKSFEKVRCEPAPDKVTDVADAMGKKYTSDILIRYFDHPLTCRLVPE